MFNIIAKSLLLVAGGIVVYSYLNGLSLEEALLTKQYGLSIIIAYLLLPWVNYQLDA